MNLLHMNAFVRFSKCTSRFLQLQPLSHRYSTTADNMLNGGKTGLDAVVSYISCYMQKEGRPDTDLLVIDNPAHGNIVNKFKRAGVKKIACTVKDEGHSMNIQDQLPGSKHIYHYNLLRMHKRGTNVVLDALQKEEEMLSTRGSVTGVVILASFVSDLDSVKNYLSYQRLTNRLLTRDTWAGFHNLRNISWFCALSTDMLMNLHGHYKSARLHNTFYEHKHCVNMKYADTRSIFYNDIDPHELGRRGLKLIDKDVCLVNFSPNFGILERLTLDDREAYERFGRQIHGAQRLIPALEKWVPGSGLGLIELGYGMADEIPSIPPLQFLQVFQDVRSLPEYEGSALHNVCSMKEDSVASFNVVEKSYHSRRKIMK